MTRRRVSVVVNTYNRADSLRRTLESLEQLDYSPFEVVVVNGPSTDSTCAVLKDYGDRIKRGTCDERNLSASRNIGIRLSAGEIVAFIDDDAYPDPGWLDALASAYDDSEVAAAGGPVFNFTGTDIQAWTSFVDRLGNCSVEWHSAADLVPYITSPSSNFIVYTIGTNSSFRRDLLVGVGGFDEEFEYYLDETDVCRRLVDIGYVIRPLDTGFVYHKFLPSHVREHPDAVKDHLHVLKSKFYFALKHGSGRTSLIDICADAANFVTTRREHVDAAIARGLLTVADRQKFDADADQAWNVAEEAFLSGRKRTRSVGWFESLRAPFAPFVTLAPKSTKLHVCLLAPEYPPESQNGIGRVVQGLAIGLAARGHLVRVLTSTSGYPTADLEERVWVHRIPIAHHDPPGSPHVPQPVWDFSATMLQECKRIDARRAIDIVHAPSWDSSAVAVELDGRFRVVIGMYRPPPTMTDVEPHFATEFEDHDQGLNTMVDLERWTFQHADGVLASSTSVLEEVAQRYNVSFGDTPTALVSHGLPELSSSVTPVTWPGKVNALFVGRLDAREGIDTLLGCVPRVAERFPDAVFTIVGDTSPLNQNDITFRQSFEDAAPHWRGRVQFAGIVDDRFLRRLYAGCDLVVVPSRVDSFGLAAIESMMFAKPVVAAGVGALRSIVIDGETGSLVSPGDTDALCDALGSLVSSEELRERMGRAGRRRYEQQHSLQAISKGVEAFFREVAACKPAGSAIDSDASRPLRGRP